ncbi:trafficking protein particle complex subunit 8-like [Choristoneura fumiferana]|uniref:trafficking protein particle complex subunit 8-like n=1 Tax=Choristoneura fumiferana TaxID=7141 RepID=UPI003D15A8D5
MAKSGKTAQEFIQNSFSPVVAVLCSPKVDNITAKNNLSFTELLQPFTSLDFEGQIREPSGGVCVIKNWKLIVRDVHWKPLPPTEARKQLNNAVLYNYNDKTVLLEIDGHKFDVPQSTPWFDAWRETYLEVQFPSDHEYTKHFLSCIIVGTTLDDNIVDTFNSLNQQYAQLQNVTPPKLPKWFNQGVLKSYLLLHDVSAVARDKADAAFETLKQTFGSSNCFMLSINSKSTTDPSLPLDFWAQYIKRSNDSNSEMSSGNLPTTPPDPQPFPTVSGSPEDGNTLTASIPPEGMHPLTTSENDIYDNANSLQTHSFSGSSESMNVSVKPLDYSTEVHGLALNALDVESIKKFTQEYALKALLPFVEKQISQLSEVVANRKGVSRSLLSATKRWFGTGKGGNTTGNNTVIYSNDCPELQLRRLGDLWFLCGQWQRAFDTYHTAKREFYADSAWLCYAGALEMAAVSAFMAGDANKKTHGYMEESIVTYLNTCRMVQYSVRATLLSVLCLSSSGSFYGEAAKQLIRMTSEDSDLRSAMLLEQASLCFLSGPGTKAMCRKYAFHMVLAGHRFSKAGQKKHAYRCYNQAYQVYAASGWRLSTDHVQFALGRLASALRLTRDAVRWLGALALRCSARSACAAARCARRSPRTSRTPSCASTCWRTRYCVLCVGRLTRDAVRWLGAPLAPAARALQPAHQQDAFLREYMLAHQVLYCVLCVGRLTRDAVRWLGAPLAPARALQPAHQQDAFLREYMLAHQVLYCVLCVGRLTRDAVRWLGAPLAPAARALQPAHQQDAFLREYMLAHQQWVESSEEFKEHLPVLPLPLLESEATAVLCVGPAPLSSPGREPASSLSFADAATRHEERVWHKLEEMLLQVAQGSVPMIFKPTVDLYTSKTDRNPVVPQGEPIQISITLRNPLKIVTILKDVELLWQFVANSDDLESTKQILNNELMVASGSSLESSAICGQKIKSVILEGESSKSLIFSITPLQIGQLCVQGVAYKLINGGEGGNENTNGSMILGKLDLLSEMNASDKLLQITVIPQAPCLQMTFTESNRAAISGELRVVDVELRNVGPVDMGPVYFAAEHPDCVHLLAPDPAAAHAEPFRELYEEKYKEPTVYTGGFWGNDDMEYL